MQIEVGKTYKNKQGDDVTIASLVPGEHRTNDRYYMAMTYWSKKKTYVPMYLSKQGVHAQKDEFSIKLDEIKLFSTILNKEIVMPWFNKEDWVKAGSPEEIYFIYSDLSAELDTNFDPDNYDSDKNKFPKGVHTDKKIMQDWAEHLQGYFKLAKGEK